MIVAVRHNFETAHRLPFLEGKCQSIHGHSWWVEWQFESEMDENGLTYEYGELKGALRGWVDTFLDHGTMLGIADKLLPAFREDGGKLWVFDPDQAYTLDCPWPTVEAVAQMLARMPTYKIGLTPVQVEVQETHVNKAIWRR